MTFDGIRRFSPYWSFALCYGVVTAVGLIPGLLYGNEMGFWLILPFSALLCTFRAAYRALPRYGLMPLFVGLWAIVLPFATFGAAGVQSLFYGLVPSVIGVVLGFSVRKLVLWYRNR